MSRYALYFAPATGSPWWQAGWRWLGRDASTADNLPRYPVSGVPPLMLEKLTADARRYGFHATLKAPFRLNEGFDESHLLTMAQAFAAAQRPVELQGVRIGHLGDFLALRPSGPLDEIAALAMRCVSYFDNLRAAPTATELAKRRRAGLSARQEALLQRWGYPYTEEEFRFHLTLTDSLAGVDADAVYALRKAAEECFAPVMAGEPLTIDALTIFREDKPGTPFSVWRRIPFGPFGPFGTQEQNANLPASGRLFFFVGASGVGKDALLRWAELHKPADVDVVFTRRVITRPAHPSEPHEAIDAAAFWQLASTGQFAMIWQANGLCYGIRRGIEADLKAGRDVIVNGSREYIPQLRQLFPDARIVWVEADAAVIRQRIESRQRESGAALLQRLDRITQYTPPESEEVIRLDNSGPLEVAGRRLLEVLSRR
jgi:phosphonate metabolism protein PhnN/1,5-bisphosphokinase (PRPP-forming)